MSGVTSPTQSADTPIIILQADPGNNSAELQLNGQNNENNGNLIVTLPIDITSHDGSSELNNTSEMDGEPVLGGTLDVRFQMSETAEESVMVSITNGDSAIKVEQQDTGELSQSVLYTPEQVHDWEHDNSGGSEIASHIRALPVVKPFCCPFCDKGFNVEDALTQHKKLHTGERPFFCPHCDMRFNRKAHLERHVRAHTGEKPFACDQCSKRFSERYYLILHTRIHTGQKPYPCQQCEMKFTRKSHLTRHLKTHRLS